MGTRGDYTCTLALRWDDRLKGWWLLVHDEEGSLALTKLVRSTASIDEEMHHMLADSLAACLESTLW